MLSFVVLAQFLLIIIFLFTNQQGRRLSNLLLGSFFSSLFLGMLDSVFILHGLVSNPNFALIFNAFVILHPPLLLLYTYSITRKDFQLRRKHLLHTIPFLVITALLIFFYHSQPAAAKEVILADVERGSGRSNMAILVGGLLYEIAYLVPVKLEINRYRLRIRESLSNVENLDLQWLNLLVNFFIISFVFGTMASLVRQVNFEYVTELALTLGSLGLFLFINAVLLKGLYNNQVFTRSISSGEDGAIPEDIQADLVLDKLQAAMSEHKPYLDPYLSLDGLSEQIQVAPRVLSLVLNNRLGQNFFDYINRHRIQEARTLLADSERRNKTILEIMYDTGFNSKSSFNTAFKKYTGMTPSSYRSKNAK